MDQVFHKINKPIICLNYTYQKKSGFWYLFRNSLNRETEFRIKFSHPPIRKLKIAGLKEDRSR